MMLIEVFAPKGALSEEQRQHVAERLLTEVTYADDVPSDVLERARSLWQVVVHEPEAWIVGERSLEPTDPPYYIVRMSVPEGSLTDEARADHISSITRVLAEADEDPQRFYREPHVWVHLIEVPESNFGSFGQTMRTSDIVNMIVNPGGNVDERSTPAEEPAPETAVDPICGMTVALTDTAITLEYDGITYAFCGTGCRDVFAQQRAGTRE